MRASGSGPVAQRRAVAFIPLTNSSDNLPRCLGHLTRSISSDCNIYVLDGTGRNYAIGRICEQWESVNYLRYGDLADSAELCRWAYEQLEIADCDVWILDPGVEIEPGVLEEMMAALFAYEKHGIVLPRSNWSGISGIPVIGPEVPAAESFAAWLAIREDLPQFQVIPSTDGPIMLIRREIVGYFGLFGIGEDAHDYGLRINRYGYSTVLANRAFAKVSPKSGELKEQQELQRYLRFDIDPIDYFAALALPHRPRILFDLFHLAPHYYGTADFALNLLRGVQVLAGEEFELYIDIQPPAFEFFLPELQGYQFYDPNAGPKQFDLVFKPTQINSWEELERINGVAPRVAYTILDMIAVRCEYLSTPGKSGLFRTLASLCDHVFAISQSVADDFEALTGSTTQLHVIHLGTNYGVSVDELFEGTYVLIMGNAYTHKGLTEALSAVDGTAFPIVVLGVNAPADGPRSNVRYLESGSLSRDAVRDVLAGARALVYPSHYEGFGLPVIDALALGKPVFVLDSAVNREMEALTQDTNLHRISSVHELPATLEEVLSNPPDRGAMPPRRWRDAAAEYIEEFRRLLNTQIDAERLRARWNFLRVRQA